MFEEVFKDHFYHEFVIRCDDAGLVNRKLLAHGFVGGLELEEYYSDMKGCLLFCATESTKLEDIDRLAKLLEGM